MGRVQLIFLLLIYLSSCSGLAVPAASGTPRTLEQLAARSEEARLQVLITYNGAISTHAAIRLEHPTRNTLFWDPAGLYGQADSDDTDSSPLNRVTRNNDVLWEDAPSLPAYWIFAEITGDTAMEVLEWRLPQMRAEELYDILVASARPGGFKGFTTATTEPFCSIAVSDFLHRYGQGIVQVPDSYLFPTSLAEQLRRQTPDRILIFSAAKSPMEYRGKNFGLRDFEFRDRRATPNRRKGLRFDNVQG